MPFTTLEYRFSWVTQLEIPFYYKTIIIIRNPVIQPTYTNKEIKQPIHRYIYNTSQFIISLSYSAMRRFPPPSNLSLSLSLYCALISRLLAERDGDTEPRLVMQIKMLQHSIVSTEREIGGKRERDKDGRVRATKRSILVSGPASWLTFLSISLGYSQAFFGAITAPHRCWRHAM